MCVCNDAYVGGGGRGGGVESAACGAFGEVRCYTFALFLQMYACVCKSVCWQRRWGRGGGMVGVEWVGVELPTHLRTSVCMPAAAECGRASAAVQCVRRHTAHPRASATSVRGTGWDRAGGGEVREDGRTREGGAHVRLEGFRKSRRALSAGTRGRAVHMAVPGSKAQERRQNKGARGGRVYVCAHGDRFGHRSGLRLTHVQGPHLGSSHRRRRRSSGEGGGRTDGPQGRAQRSTTTPPGRGPPSHTDGCPR